MEQTIIYYLHNGDNTPFYVGKTNDLNFRIGHHRKTYGEKVIMETLDVVDTSNWVFWERYWISQFKTWGFELLNKNDGGGGLTKCEFGPERGEKISIANKGMSKSHKGRPFTEDHKAKIKAKRDHLKNRKNTWQNVVVVQMDLDGEFIKEWESQKQAQLYFNKPNSDGVGACCRGEQKTAYGYKWKFKK
jgi:hypothetical protein